MPGALAESEHEELRLLRKENHELKLEREILRRAAAYSRGRRPVSRVRFVAGHRVASARQAAAPDRRLLALSVPMTGRAGRPDVAPAPGLVARAFGPARRDAVWTADVTQLRAGDGWLHLAVVVDLSSRRIAG